MQGGPTKPYILGIAYFPAVADIHVVVLLLKCSEIIAEEKTTENLKLSVKYSSQTSRNVVPCKCQWRRQVQQLNLQCVSHNFISSFPATLQTISDIFMKIVY